MLIYKLYNVKIRCLIIIDYKISIVQQGSLRFHIR